MSYQVEQQSYLQAVDKSSSEDYDSDNSSCATSSDNYNQLQNNNEQTTKVANFTYLTPTSVDNAAGSNGAVSQDANRLQLNYFNSAPAYVGQYPKTNDFEYLNYDYQMKNYLNGLSYNETVNNPSTTSYSDMLARTYSMVNFYSGFNQQSSVNDENYPAQAAPNSSSEPENNSGGDKSNNDSSNEDEKPEPVKKPPAGKSNSRSKKPVRPNSKQPQQAASTLGSANTPSYLAQAPDSESLALAAAQAVEASRNRSKKRIRIKFDQRQLDILEAAFERTHYPDVNVVDRLSTLLNLTTERISVWFQNRRARFKRTYKPGSKSEPKQEDAGEESSLNSSNSNAPQFNMANFSNDQQTELGQVCQQVGDSNSSTTAGNEDSNSTGESTDSKNEKSESCQENNKPSIFAPYMVPQNSLYNSANAFQMYQTPSYFVPNYSQTGGQLKLPTNQDVTYNQPAISPQSTSSIAPSSTSPSASDDQSTASKSPSPLKKEPDSEVNNQPSDKASDEEDENVNDQPNNGLYQQNMAQHLYKQAHANIFQPYIDCTVPNAYSAYNFVPTVPGPVGTANLQYFAPQIPQSYNYFYP